MTKQKLLELCIKLRNKEITKAQITKLKELNDKEIDIVLKSQNKEALIRLLNNQNFKSLSPKIKSQIINIINKCDDQYGKVEHIINVATNINAISTNLLVELLTIISEAKGINQSYISSLVAINFNAIASGQVLELTKILSKCDKIEQLNIAYCAATNLHVISSGNVIDTVTAILNAKDKQEALNLYYQSINSSLDTNYIEVLSEGKVQALDFWQIFAEEGEYALYLIDDYENTDKLSPQTIITKDTIINKKRK